MSRYPDHFIEKIKREIDLPALFRAKGAALKPTRNGGFTCLCPFRPEKTPSMNLNILDGVWVAHCFGCNWSGDGIKFFMETEGVSFVHAIELLSNGHGHLLMKSDQVVRKSTVPRLPSPVELIAADHEAMTQVMDYYHERLKLNGAALEYLKDRRIGTKESIDAHQIGFSDRTLGLRLPDSNRKAGSEIRERLKRLGIYRANGREHFNGCLVFPIKAESGIITEVYGRAIGKLRPGTPNHLYLPGPHKGIWNPMALNSEELVLCECIIDALSFWCHGFRNVTSLYGVSGLTDELFQAIVASPVRVIRLAYDHDDAGDTHAHRHAERFLKEGKDCFRIVFPRGMDANEYIRKVDNPCESLQHLVNSAVWLGKGTTTTIPIDQPPNATGEQSITAGSEKIPPAGPKRGDVGTVDAKVSWEKVEIDCDDRHYRILGLHKNMSYGVLRVNMRLMVDGLYYDDEINLYKARGKEHYIKAAALEVGCAEDTIKRDLGKIVLTLEELQDERIQKALEPKNKPVVLTDEEREEALALLRDPNLLDRVVADFETCGVVGEQTNVAVGYIICVSRLLPKPLGAIIQSMSAAGKTFLMDVLLSFMPEETVIKYSAMTGQSLFYMGETELKHKILAIEEQEGAEKISYSLKLLLSEGKLVIKSTGKNPTTGRHEAHDYKVEGPLVPLSSTTCLVITDELQNRLIILTMNESREQTRAIHRLQRWLRTLDGQRTSREWEHIRTVHRNAQRLLRPLEVVNPYACGLTFIDDKTRTRRDQLKYLTLIDAIALLHQYQRPIKTYTSLGREHQYIEVTLEDIEIANRMASEILGRSLDELPPHTRKFLSLVDEIVTEECGKQGTARADYRFTRRLLCDRTGWSYDQVRVHIMRLVDLEYVLIHKGSRGQQCVYELLYDGKGRDGKPFMVGLIDVDALHQDTDLSI